jgi:D-aspartate ligase
VNLNAASFSKIPVLVLKIGRYRLHHGGVAVIRTLGRADVPVYAVLEDRFVPAATSRYLAGGFVWTAATDILDVESFVAGMSSISERISRPCIVIPTDDQAAVLLDETRDRISQQFILPAHRCGLARRLTDKRNVAELARLAGCAVPVQTVIRCPAPDSAVVAITLPRSSNAPNALFKKAADIRSARS